MSIDNRRPIKARSLVIIQRFASWLAKSSITPNQISVLSIGFSLLVPISFVVFEAGTWVASLGAMLGIQLRLLCNLLDGMVAIEGQKKSVAGGIYNEFPDRIADTVILVGVAACDISDPWLATLGMTASFLAAMTAYTRLLGASLGTKQYFDGPMAKQHRMAFLTLTMIALPILNLLVLNRAISSAMVIKISLIVISIGCIATVFRRLRKISSELQLKANTNDVSL
jgi:phosphatidylglycerophosphate synthase